MKRKFIFCLIILIILTSCAQKEESQVGSIVIASWNVQNLFNAVEDGHEYDEYLSQNGWNESQYRVRLKKVETVLGYDNLKDASIIILNEVENESVVEDILSLKSLKQRGFCHYACCGEETGAIKTAVISKYPISCVNVHAIPGQRPVLEVVFSSEVSNLVVLAVHGKSNLGDEEKDAEIRNTCGRVIEELVFKIKGERPSSTIVLSGDFNEEFSDGNIVQTPSVWKNFWEGDSLNAGGSYCYKNDWKAYDNILVSRFGTWNQIEGNVVFYGILRSLDNKPDAWTRYLLSGVSDHLPVWIKLVR